MQQCFDMLKLHVVGVNPSASVQGGREDAFARQVRRFPPDFSVSVGFSGFWMQLGYKCELQVKQIPVLRVLVVDDPHAIAVFTVYMCCCRCPSWDLHN